MKVFVPYTAELAQRLAIGVSELVPFDRDYARLRDDSLLTSDPRLGRDLPDGSDRPDAEANLDRCAPEGDCSRAGA